MKPDEHQGLTYALSYLAVATTGVIATLVFLILPIMVGGIADQFGWSEKQVGWLAAADMGGSAIASLVLAGFIAKLEWKKSILIAICFAVAGNLISIFMDSLGSLLLIRVLTGFSNGVIMSIVFAMLCRSANPDRHFGVYVFLQLSLQAILLPLLPQVIALWGMSFVYVFLALASIASMSLLLSFPKQPVAKTPSPSNRLFADPSADVTSADGSGRRGALALFAQAVYFLAPAAIWGYFEVIGEGFNLTSNAVGNALGLASLAGMAGALLVVVLANRFGRNLNMTVGTVLSMAAVWLLMQGSGFFGFLLAAVLLNFSWNYTFPYQMGTLALFDKDGSIAVLGLVVQTFGLSIGPIMASLLLVGSDFSNVLWVCGGCYGVSLLLFLACSYLEPQHYTKQEQTRA